MSRDLAADLLRHGYHAIPDARRRAGDPPVCPVKLLGDDAVVVSGPASVRRFYDPRLIRRSGAVPQPLATLLFGRGAVHGLDGEEHQHRKGQFLGLLDDAAASTLEDLVHHHLGTAIRERNGETVSVFHLLSEVYARAVLAWAGISVRHPDKVGRRLAGIVDGFGISGPSYATAWAARLWANRWARGLIREARSATTQPTTPVETIATWRDPEGELLPVPVAAVELLNVLRPAVAVAYLGTFAVQTLDDEPALRPMLAEDPARRHAFTQEVRRIFPFVPALAGSRASTVTGTARSSRRGSGSSSTYPGPTWTRPRGPRRTRSRPSGSSAERSTSSSWSRRAGETPPRVTGAPVSGRRSR